MSLYNCRNYDNDLHTFVGSSKLGIERFRIGAAARNGVINAIVHFESFTNYLTACPVPRAGKMIHFCQEMVVESKSQSRVFIHGYVLKQ